MARQSFKFGENQDHAILLAVAVEILNDRINEKDQSISPFLSKLSPPLSLGGLKSKLENQPLAEIVNILGRIIQPQGINLAAITTRVALDGGDWVYTCDDEDLKHIKPPAEVIKKTGEVIAVEVNAIDNPGRGNCAFYAFAHGLIHIIQTRPDHSPVLKRWLELDPSINGLVEGIKKYSFHNQDRGLLDQLQASLRTIGFQYRLSQLQKACKKATSPDYKELTETSEYGKFAALYFKDSSDGSMDATFNEFAGSEKIKAAIELVRAQVAREKNSEIKVLAPLFIKLIYGEEGAKSPITEGINPISDSPIIEELAKIKDGKVWGDHNHMDDLARAFDVNLHTIKDNEPVQKYINDKPDRPVITLINRGNSHWETGIPGVAAPALSAGPTRVALPPSRAQAPVSGGKPPRSLSPLANQGRRSLAVSTSTATPAPKSDKDELDALKAMVALTTAAYLTHNEKSWLSIFHRHGAAGRARADKFQKSFAQIGLGTGTDSHKVLDPKQALTDARDVLAKYLKNSSHGNTHPHSYRTMLLNSLVNKYAGKKSTLQETSQGYLQSLLEFTDQYYITGKHLPTRRM